MKNTYIVSGLERCGTSLAMQCLRGATGATIFASPFKGHATYDGYDPNPEGYYEVKSWSKWGPDWSDHIQGKLVKVMSRHILRLGAAKKGYRYKILWMTRDFTEMNMSRERCGKLPLSEDDVHILVQRNQGILRMRRDVDLVVIDYSDFINRPDWVIKKLQQAKWGIKWPENFKKCINPKLYRNRKIDDNTCNV